MDVKCPWIGLKLKVRLSQVEKWTVKYIAFQLCNHSSLNGEFYFTTKLPSILWHLN